jgi:5'-3' exonuclease
MGIERFFNSLVKSESIKENGIIVGLKDKINASYLYIDFNSIIYNVVTDIEKDLNYLLYSIIDNNLDEESTKISVKWNYDINIANIDNYKIHFSSELIDKEAIDRITKQIIYISSQIINPEELELLYIAIDGVPQMSKIIEQKKRRYNGYISSKIKDKIYKSHYDDLPEKRKTYEMNKISYDRSKIISWTSFMSNILLILQSHTFLHNLKSLHPNIKHIIVNDQNNKGEGEKKIMEHIIESKAKGSYVIYSPDADAIILGIIGQNILNNSSEFNILRYNSQSNEYDLVNISILCDNIYAYATNMCKLNKNDFNKLNVTNDIAFIFTLFGNDFIPKLESIDVRNDIETLMNIYCGCMAKSQKKYIIFNNKDGTFKINYINFFNLINQMAQIEDILLLDTFMSNKYRNYHFYKRELKIERLYPFLIDYIETTNKLFDELRSLDSNISTINTLINNYNIGNYIKYFLILEGQLKRSVLDNYDDDKLLELFKNLLIKMINNKKIYGKIKFQLYDTHNTSTDFHTKNIKDNLPHPAMEITSYDIDSYKLDRKMGSYEVMLNAIDFSLGSINISLYSNGNYKFIPYNKLSNIINYYDTFFDISYKKISHNGKNTIMFDQHKMETLVNDYIKGLFWVFNTYFNKNNSSQNSNFISTWFYPHHRVPLIYQVRDILTYYKNKDNNLYITKMNELFTEVTSDNRFIVPKDGFMTKLEHYIYVTPKNKQKDVPHIYDDIINNINMFPDLNSIVDDIWSGNNTNNIIDCRRIPYFNKCNLLTVPFVKFNEFMKLVIPLRDDNHNLTKILSYTKNELKYYKNYYKHLYIATNACMYKKYYKSIKTKL